MNEKSPWIKPTDRLPAESDGRFVIALHKQGFYIIPLGKTVAKNPERYDYWMPIPKVPHHG